MIEGLPMESVLTLTPAQQILIVAVQLWLVVFFPLLILRKLNHISNLLEIQVYQDEEEESSSEL
ncbi:MAG TPA: hypothetical protein P5246_06850 [Candidatus Omnitrophota bacterium]|nr:hypothetical protein [Candidatus Omnitrophota bacterium]HSA30787.1 hypothetical protein [Candidatus Omnitrophota bacterium]